MNLTSFATLSGLNSDRHFRAITPDFNRPVVAFSREFCQPAKQRKLTAVSGRFRAGQFHDSRDRSVVVRVGTLVIRIGLATAFKREVIAEGVETAAYGTALLLLGCELAQG